MALPNPGSLWKWAKYILREAQYVVPAALSWLEADLSGNEGVAELHWMRWNTYLTRATPAGLREDREQFGINLVNITGGQVDSTWTAGDFATVKALFDTWLTSVKAHINNAHTFVEYRAYHMAFNPDDPGPANRGGSGTGPFADSGPPLYVATMSTACTGGATAVPYQVAGSVTFRTPWPKHWGRIYLPAPGSSDFDANGRWTAGYRTAIANATRALFDDLADAEFLPVVPVTQLDRSTFHALLAVTDVVVDDVPDVQRRRRPKQAAAHTIGA